MTARAHEAGQGATLNGQPIRASTRTEFSGARVPTHSLPKEDSDLVAVDQPNSIVITQRKAEKYFPNENPVGKTLIINNNEDKPYTIGGVIERLEQKGWVARVVSERDRRARELSLTPEGERTFQALVPVVRGLQDEILQSLGDADRSRFLKLARQAVGQ